MIVNLNYGSISFPVLFFKIVLTPFGALPFHKTIKKSLSGGGQNGSRRVGDTGRLTKLQE